MNLNKKEIYIKEVLNNLNTISIKRLSKKEINFFDNKKILITGVSGIIGINLLFFFNKLNIKKKKIYMLMGPTILLFLIL